MAQAEQQKAMTRGLADIVEDAWDHIESGLDAESDEWCVPFDAECVGAWSVYGITDGLRLLYVGCTCNPARRFSEHRARGQFWHYETLRIVVFESHKDQDFARQRERELIEFLKPIHNTTHCTEFSHPPEPIADDAHATRPGPKPKHNYTDAQWREIAGVWRDPRFKNDPQRVAAIRALGERFRNFDRNVWFSKKNPMKHAK